MRVVTAISGRLVDTMYRSWRIHALCFSGFCLAVAAKGACCSFVSLVDVPWSVRSGEALTRGGHGHGSEPVNPPQ